MKDALRRQTVDRIVANDCIRFLGQPMGRSLHKKLKDAYDAWTRSRDDAALQAAVALLATEFSKQRPAAEPATGLRREDLSLVCFEYVTG